MTMSTENRTKIREEKLVLGCTNELFFKKIQKKSLFSLNSGNFCLTLQLELCPDVSLS